MVTKVLYICQVCGNNTHRWVGKCSSCGSWDSIIGESVESNDTKDRNRIDISLISLSEDDESLSETIRYDIGIEELNRVFGGGVVLGSTVLIGGEPGVGKSTLLLQISAILAKNFADCLYSSGEESVEQVRLRAKRLQICEPRVKFVSTSSLLDIIDIVKKNSSIKFLVIDSIQTIYDSRIVSAPGTIVQVRMCTQELINFTKKRNIVLFILGQITKDGQIAGPKTLEHMVDTVLYFEGESSSQLRILRTVKNRFGPTNEIGVFEMSDKGLSPVSNPSALFLVESHNKNVVGSAVFAGIEGSRPILMEIQALAAKTYMATPRRAVVGWDINRLAMIIAVLSSRCNIFLGDKEVYLNIAGGLKIYEPAADLAVAAALISSFINIPLPKSTIVCGEIALSGDIRNVVNLDLRLKEAYKLGFERAIIPNSSNNRNFSDLELLKLNHIRDLRKIFG